MRLVSRFAAALLLFAASVAQAQTNYTTKITLANLLSGGVSTPYAKICAIPADAYGNPIAVSAPTWGLVLPAPGLCANAVAGALPSAGLPVPDANHTNSAAPIFYNVSIQVTTSTGLAVGAPVLFTKVPNVTGATYALDTYTPTVVASTPLSNIVGSGTGVPSSCTAPSLWLATDTATGYLCRAGSYVALIGPSQSGPIGAPGANGVASPPQLAQLYNSVTDSSQTNFFNPAMETAAVTLSSSTGTTSAQSGYTVTGLVRANAGGQMTMSMAVPAPVTSASDPDKSTTANLYNTADAVVGSLITAATNTSTSYGGTYAESPYLVVSGLSTVYVNTSVIGGQWGPVFYDASHNFLSAQTSAYGSAPACSPQQGCSTPVGFAIPAAAYYMRYGLSGDVALVPGTCQSYAMAASTLAGLSSCTAFSAAPAASNHTGVAFFDLAGNYVSGFDGPLAANTPFSVPSSGAYLRAAFASDPTSSLMICNGSFCPASYQAFGTYSKSTVDSKIAVVAAAASINLPTVWPAMKGLDWWLPLEDATGATASDATGNGHTGTLAGTGYAWNGPAGIQLGSSASISIPNAGGRISIGQCARFSAGGGSNNAYNYLRSSAIGGENGQNIGTAARAAYTADNGDYSSGLAFFPSVGYSNGDPNTHGANGFTGNHCVAIIMGEGAGGTAGKQHIIVDGQEVSYVTQANGDTATIGGAELTGPMTVQGWNNTLDGSPVTVYSAWATSATTAETVAMAAARTASEVARLKSLGVVFGPPTTSQAYDSSCAFDGTSIDVGYQAGSVHPSSLLALDFPCTLHDFAVSGQGSLDIDAGFEDRAGSVYHPKAARNIAYTGGVTNGIAAYTETPARAFLDTEAWNRKAHALGYKTIVSTMMSRTGSVGSNTVDSLAQQYNALVLAAGDEFDWVDNLAANPNLGATGAYNSTTYFADGVHPNTTGQALYVAAERAAFEGVYANPLTSVSASYTVKDADRLIVSSSASATTITLKDATLQSFNSAGKLCVKNAGTATLTLAPVSSQTINGASSATLAAGASLCLSPYVANPAAGGANWITR